MAVKRIIFYLLIILLLQSCGWHEENEKPDSPVWVQKSQPQDSIETGIDAEPLEHRIFMHWHPVLNKDLEGYRIFRTEIKDVLDREAKEKWEKISEINIFHNPEFDTVYYDEQVKLNYLYRYVLRAFDYDGNMSDPSDTIEYVLIEKASLIYPVENRNVPVTPDFKWRNNSRTNEIVLRLEHYPTGKVVWIPRFMNPSYTEDIITRQYNFDGSALEQQLVPGEKYRWRIDCIASTNIDNTDLEGSESAWQYFTVND